MDGRIPHAGGNHTMDDLLYELAALDMDGTLLNSRHETTAFTREVLRRADEAGKVIALCTGRCLSELTEHLAAIPGIRYAICENGGCVYDVAAGRVIRQVVIDRAAAERLLDLAEERDALVQCFFGGQSWIQLTDPALLARFHMAEFEGVFAAGSRFTGDVRRAWRDSGLPLEKLNLYFADGEEKRRYRRAVGQADLHFSDSLGIGYEISPGGATKASGLEALCRHLGLHVARAMAVGDGANDVELMRAAGLAVAMANAVEEVRRAADVVAGDCDHDGAARAVLKYLLGEG